MKPVDSFRKSFPLLYPNYRHEAEVFFQYCADQNLEYSVDAVRAYNLYIPNHLKFGTYNKRLAAAKKVVEQWVQKTAPEDFPATMFNLKTIKGKKKADKSIPSDRIHFPAQVVRMQEAASKRTSCLILFLSSTGVRISEAAGIRLSDIAYGPEKSMITINGKGNKERKIQVASDLIDRAKLIFKSKEYLFESYSHCQCDPQALSRSVTRAGKKIGVRSSAHRMRHSFATQFLKENPGKFKELSQYLGHSSVQITMDIYAHNQMEYQDLEASNKAFRLPENAQTADLP